MSDKIRAALDTIERRRDSQDLSKRRAAERIPEMSEGTWRQLMRGFTMQRGQRVERVARTSQVLDMAAAVGALDEVALLIGADREQVAAARARVTIPDPTEDEIRHMRHASIEDKVVMLKALRQSREEDSPK